MYGTLFSIAYSSITLLSPTINIESLSSSTLSKNVSFPNVAAKTLPDISLSYLSTLLPLNTFIKFP